MNTHPTLLPGRLIWIALLSVMAAALVTDQARANLPAEARAGSRYGVQMDDRQTVESLCRMRFDVLAGQVTIGFDAADQDPALKEPDLYGDADIPHAPHELP